MEGGDGGDYWGKKSKSVIDFLIYSSKILSFEKVLEID